MNDRRLPIGTVTFLFTDIEGSTRLVAESGDAFRPILEEHNEIIARAIATHDGITLATEGDSFFAVFVSAPAAAAAAITAQLELSDHIFPDNAQVKVRMGLHTGEGATGGSNYIGIDVHRAARIAHAAHGGQIVMSEATALLAERDLAEGVSIVDLGKHRLKDLSDPEAIFQIAGPGLEREFPPLRSLNAIRNNLPLQVTSFVGREDVLAEAIALLERARVLTLTGPGGTGKTRLSLQVAAETSDRFPDGVFFVALSSVSDPHVVPSSILASLEIQTQGSDQPPRAQLLAQLANKRLLLILDNYEQLLPAADLVAELVRASPGSKFLVTSRAALRISGEQELPVPPLEVVAAEMANDPRALMEVEAVRLFVDRARAVRPDFELSEENAAAVAGLVNMLDGLPLAIELVAPRLRLFPVATILERLDTRMLSSGSVDLPARQQTIEGAIGWSYDLLEPPIRALFESLSVFAGGARLEELESVVGDVDDNDMDLIEGLAKLVDHSLLRASQGVTGPRFRLLHVIREYGLSRLEERGDADEMRRRHLVAYVSMVEEVAPELLRRDRKMWLDQLEEEHDNLRAAFEWGLDREVDLTLRLAARTWRFWQARGYLHEALERIDKALAQDGGTPASRAKAMEARGGVLWWQGEMELTHQTYQDVLALQREIGDPREIANALYNHSLAVVFSEGDPAVATAALDEAEAIYRELADTGGLGDVEWARGDNAMFLDEFDESIEHMIRAAELYKEAGNEFGRGWSEFQIASSLVKKGRAAEAWSYVRDGLEVFAAHDDRSAITLFLALMAAVAEDAGDRSRAVLLGGVYHSVRIASGTALVNIDFNRVPGLEYEMLEALEGDLGEAYRRGKEMPLDEAIRFALDWEPATS